MNSATANGQPTVFLVDDDADVLTSLSWLLESVDRRVAAYQSPQEFLNSYDPNVPGCLVLDIHMPGMSGLELQIELAGRGCRHPIIFVTGHGDIATCSKAFRGGAFDFIEKPVNDQALVELVNQAVSADAARRIERGNRPDFSAQQSRLTPREQEVMDLLVEGKSVKQIAVELGVGFPTAARHRSRVLEKMGVVNDVELVRMVLSATT